MPIITVPKPLRERLGEEGAEALVQLINQATEAGKGDVVAVVEEKFERRLTEEASKLRAEIGHLRGEMIERIESVRSELTGRIESVRSELTGRIESVRSELSGRIESVRSELIKWMFVFWVGQIGAIVGILFAFFRK
jgi:DNA anti-recombination protein RmuC